MTELDKITTEVSPSSFVSPPPKSIKTLDDLILELKEVLNLSIEESHKLTQGMVLEKNKESPTQKILCDSIINIIDSSKAESENSKHYSMYIQNRKMNKDMVLNIFNVLKYYDSNDRILKLILAGTVIQSLYDRKK